ncbi:hypothetical protein [Quatrionicoccus australiensis]|uniref:hypothetical protein n=1 Tax=Quatrionicoccus australiensis TaxID=138118 RepID=UPI001CF8AE89|nr:hypothetical protein [Quatrionicoccus australiensis]UCV15897.1 hypothetical protein KI612_04095 [Quatrionicoccus australiensis]
MLLAYHLIFRNYFPLANGRMGHDYVLTLGGFLDGFLWYKNNGFITPPWFTPSFCGGQALFADPQSAFYSLPQFLTFIVDPLQAVYSAFLIFAGLGFWGMYLFSRRCLYMGRLSALVAATVFMFNGFYAHRIIIGHYGYQSFMLVPFIAYLLLKVPDSPLLSARSIRQSLIAGLAVAYWFHSGLTTLMIPATLAVIGLACVMAISTREYIAKTFLVRGLVAGAVAIALSASKLNANMALMSNFSRDYYPLPGVSDIGGLLTFVFQSLFYSSEHTYQTVTPLWKNMQWAAMPHELAYGLTPLPLLVMLVGAGAFALSKQSQLSFPAQDKSSTRFPSIVLGAILLVPMALLYYSPEWNSVLKNLPLIGSTTSPYRWLIIYIPLIAAVTGIIVKASGKYKTWLAVITVVGIPLLNALESREYYQQQDFDPTPIVSYYNAVRRGEITPQITQVADPKAPNGYSIIDNGLFLTGISPMRCYNPIYGYRLEKLQIEPLVPGPITSITPSGSLNLHNPACLVFPAENNCKLWDAFKASQSSQLLNFASYKPYPFERSSRQYVADWITFWTIFALSMTAVIFMFNRKQ